MSAIQSLVQSQRQAMITQYAAITNSINDVYRMTDLIPPVLRRVSDFMGVLVHMSELRSAIVDAMHGQLARILRAAVLLPTASLHPIRLSYDLSELDTTSINTGTRCSRQHSALPSFRHPVLSYLSPPQQQQDGHDEMVENTEFGLTATDFVVIFGGGCVLFPITTIIYAVCLAVVDLSLVTRSYISCSASNCIPASYTVLASSGYSITCFHPYSCRLWWKFGFPVCSRSAEH